MGDKSIKNRVWSGAFPKLERPPVETNLKQAKNKKDNGALIGALPKLKRPSAKTILKGNK